MLKLLVRSVMTGVPIVTQSTERMYSFSNGLFRVRWFGARTITVITLTRVQRIDLKMRSLYISRYFRLIKALTDTNYAQVVKHNSFSAWCGARRFRFLLVTQSYQWWWKHLICFTICAQIVCSWACIFARYAFFFGSYRDVLYPAVQGKCVLQPSGMSKARLQEGNCRIVEMAWIFNNQLLR